ncbi:hypothetical protein D3C72_2105740 [compost metagenome]
MGQTDARLVELPERGDLVVVTVAIETAQFWPGGEQRNAQDFGVGALEGWAERLMVESAVVKAIDQTIAAEITQSPGA